MWSNLSKIAKLSININWGLTPKPYSYNRITGEFFKSQGVVAALVKIQCPCCSRRNLGSISQFELFTLEGIFFFQNPEVCEILIPQPRVEPMLPAMEAQTLNHRTTREVPSGDMMNKRAQRSITRVMSGLDTEA